MSNQKSGKENELGLPSLQERGTRGEAMQQYVIIAQDGTDDKALDRRLGVRSKHLEGARKLKEQNNFVLGGAMLNDEGKMCGSVMVVQFETKEEFDHWYANEPYILGGVWKAIEVKPFKVADV